jgi:hypothetical protein
VHLWTELLLLKVKKIFLIKYGLLVAESFDRKYDFEPVTGHTVHFSDFATSNESESAS